MSNLINISDTFCRTEAYNAAVLNCYTFRRGTDVRNGIVLSLGNMVSGYPFEIEGIRFENSECAYIAGAFSLGTPQHLALQHPLTVCTNGFMAKKSIRKPHDNEKRADWETFNVEWMKYVVWQKCLGNEDFRHLLLCIPRDITLVRDKTEDHSQSATLWGCLNMERHNREKRLWKDFSCRGDDQDPKEWRQKLNREREKLKNIGEWKGQNNMGKILMICRDCLVVGKEPPIDYDLLRQSNIYLFGKLLTF